MRQIEEQYLGISGWLSPNGEFIPVMYGMHERTAVELEKADILDTVTDSTSGCRAHGERLLELLGYIKFTCRQKGVREVESYVFFPQQFGCKKSITEKQVIFMTANYNWMTEIQKKSVRQYLLYACKT